MTNYAIIGFGEVGSIFARDLHAAGVPNIAAFDVASVARDRAAALSYMTVHDTPGAAVAGADIVFVCVTAGSVLDAVGSLAGWLAHAPLVVDVNSVSPAVKQQGGAVITQAGGRYVEAAVMSSVPPKGIRSPMLLGGDHAAAFIDAMAFVQPNMKVFSAEIGKASSVKMCRSVMIKGLEALTTECMLSARHYGVEEYVLGSMGDTLPHEDWRGLARYVISRALIHGKRRAEEMREVARTVSEAGVEPLLSSAIAVRQDWAAQQGRAMGREVLATTDLDTLLDALVAAMHRPAQAAQ